MKPYVMLHIPVGTFMSMTDEQVKALRENVLAEGKWDSVDGELRIDGSGESYLGVHLPGIFLGIEQDGYTHS